jgi:hypothetical protein
MDVYFDRMGIFSGLMALFLVGLVLFPVLLVFYRFFYGAMPRIRELNMNEYRIYLVNRNKCHSYGAGFVIWLCFSTKVSLLRS